LSTDTGDVLRSMQTIYRELKGGTRELRPEDRLMEDLGLDSLEGYELLVALEDLHGIELIEHVDVSNVRSVGQLAELIEGRLA
jgi:acyl carrier protein